MRDIIKQSKIGSIVPIYKTIQKIGCPVEFFAKLSDYGRKENCILLESADIVPKYGENSLGSADPCLKLQGKEEKFEIIALNKLGKEFLEFISKDFGYCDEVEIGKDRIKGVLKRKSNQTISEQERLKLRTHMDIIRNIAFKFKPTTKPFVPYCGLFGAISYDFIDQFENLPKNKIDILQNMDYEFYFLDNLFLADHKKAEINFIANALIMDDDAESLYDSCMRKIDNYEKALNADLPEKRSYKIKEHNLTADTSKNEFEDIVKKLKEHILAGDIFQAVPSRTIISNYNAEPLDIYRSLRKLNPSPYMFYINNKDHILLGASPEMALRVQGNKEKIAEIRPIAGTKPRGIVNGKIDKDLDSRYESELKTDFKEVAEHTMLIDLARNDIARISKPGTRAVDEPYVVEKYSHVQHLVSNVSGILKDELDALHAYLATMNMGTLTGAPKVEAMKLIRKYEKTKRGYYGGAVAYITPSNDFDSTIVIRSMILRDDKAYIRAGAGVVYDSIPEKEFIETEKKAMACIKSIKEAGGLR